MAFFLMQKIRDYWAIILFVLMLSGAAANAQMSITDQGHRIEKLETAPERLARIETKLDMIQYQLDKMK